MLSMSMDCIESKADDVTSHLKDITKQLKQLKKPLAELNDKKTKDAIDFLTKETKKTKIAIDSIIEEMHQLDDMVHEPSYENDCLVDYWTLGALNNCVVELKEMSDLLTDSPLNAVVLATLQVKMEEANYLWNDNYLEDFARWVEKVSGLIQPIPEPEHTYSYKPLFAKVPDSQSGYGLAAEKDNSDEQDLAEALGINKFTR